MRVPLMKQAAWCLVVLMFLVGIAPRAYAGLSPSEVIAPADVDRAADLEKVQKALETKMVMERLSAFGYTEEEIGDRLALLSDQELHGLALQLDDLRVGGDGTGVLVVVLLIAVVVLLYLQYTGKRVVVTD
ncbi:MAG: PA2779 family protein [Nitrospirota bacterium]|jgi:hypothetical protein